MASLAVAVFALSYGLSPDAALAAGKRNISVKPTTPAEASGAPRTILVSIRKQRLRLLDGDREIASSRISSGQPGFDTPTGVFSILEKNVYHESNIYDGAPMPFMQRITWSGIAMHAGVVPGYRASHGCVRLPAGFAQSFFSQTSIGARVIITQDEVSPVRFEHPALFKPLPEKDPTPPSQTAITAEPKIAANDVTVAGKAALTSIVGTAAAAALPPDAATPSRPRSRQEAQRRFDEKLSALATAMKAAEDKKIASSEKAKSALKAAQDADLKLAEARRPFEDVLRAIPAAEAARDNAARAYRSFLNGDKTVAAAKPAKSSKKEADQYREAASPEDREQELEDQLLDATVALQAAKADAAQAETAIAGAKAAAEAAGAEKQKALDDVRNAITELRTAQTALVDAKADAVRRAKSLSVFISLKSQRIYIRQGFEPIFEAPIEVDNPGTVGTHVLTAIGYDATGNDFVWQLVSAQQPRVAAGARATSDDDDGGKKGKKKKEASGEPVSASSPLNVEAARVALDSIKIPEDVQEQIAEIARPGMSLIISEKDLSHETGKGTEFIVLTR